ncbi:MAG: histidine--tRNA ligase [Taibaiella sp.]|nr:histidine--tRNA ligase [Taibaiella sp.]
MKVNTPQGTRDFDALTVRKRQHILNTIQKQFELFGYQPIETPAIENLTTLMGKYGEEGDKLIFKILNNGLHEPAKHDKARTAFENILAGRSDTQITERALRYDLTIPFARYVVMNQGTLAFPFKRSQMQAVWRADRPQKGRYREFWQCDADVVGSTSLIHEAELLQIYSNVFALLGIPEVQIKLNNRKILEGLAIALGKREMMTDLTVAIDKLDKIGLEMVGRELVGKGFKDEDWALIQQFLSIQGTNEEKLDQVRHIIGHSDVAIKGINELKEILSYYQLLQGEAEDISIDFTLARGLNYYTGMITEVMTSAVRMGSIGGGGRYDDLTGLFGLKNTSGVGISFGVDRIYDVMEELQLFPEKINITTQVIFLAFTEDAIPQILQYVHQLRENGISAEFYSELGKMDKQMKYAHRRNIPFVAIIGENELENNTITLKNMISGDQQQIAFSKIFPALQNM